MKRPVLTLLFALAAMLTTAAAYAQAPQPQPGDTLPYRVYFPIARQISPGAIGTYQICDVAEYLTRYPDIKVDVLGYADAGTGTLEENTALAGQRAGIVVGTLTSMGISGDRLNIVNKAASEQLFKMNERNRVVIFVVK